MTVTPPLLRALITLLLALPVGANAHEGHDHGEQPKPAAQAGAAPRLEATSGPFELVAVLRAPRLVIYLDRFATNEPVVGAEISVETPSGPQKAGYANGTYVVEAPWAAGSAVDLIFIVTADGSSEILNGTLGRQVAPLAQQSPSKVGYFHRALDAVESPAAWLVAFGSFIAGAGCALFFAHHRRALAAALAFAILGATLTSLHAHEGHHHGDAPGPVAVQGESSQRLADGGLLVPKHVQRILAIRTALTNEAAHQKTIELPGRIIPDPNASGYVQAAVSGQHPPDFRPRGECEGAGKGELLTRSCRRGRACRS